ncbi:hypothetical protein CMQ_8116 [Grosmannia clavigera kw1407]|uniref:Uncharacterized protein n=1 Tax=Grosmannia clavigera (strain kw1407 / UAMH 11150) TaxID=655863 RepID=F0XL20_GROCL|nr:uncharacterized protein CMQ_8116 [Grosmannia clavigera kw1407]EFX01650.1 hypothetical protein CMQ_8116 [Grosmannia clavigera kw1407]
MRQEIGEGLVDTPLVETASQLVQGGGVAGDVFVRSLLALWRIAVVADFSSVAITAPVSDDVASAEIWCFVFCGLRLIYYGVVGLINDGYDKKFKVYAKVVAGGADLQVHDFMQQIGDKDSLDKSDGYNTMANLALNMSFASESEPCPGDFSERGYGPDCLYEQTVYWTLRDDQADVFYANLESATGIPKDKIGFGYYTDIDNCSGSGSKVGDGDNCWNIDYELGAPFPNGYGTDDVANPKDVAKI